MPFSEGGARGSGETGPGAGMAPMEDDKEVDLRDEHEAEVPMLVAKSPGAPSAEDVTHHEVAHIPYRSWCRSCVMGRGKSTAHKQLDTEKEHHLSTVMHDYGFLGRDDQKAMLMLVSKSSRAL